MSFDSIQDASAYWAVRCPSRLYKIQMVCMSLSVVLNKLSVNNFSFPALPGNITKNVFDDCVQARVVLLVTGCGWPEFETSLSLDFFHSFSTFFFIDMIILNIYTSTDTYFKVRPHLMGLVVLYKSFVLP